MRVCTGCGVEKSIEEFPLRSQDGRRKRICKFCAKIRAKKYRQENKNHLIQYRRNHYRANPSYYREERLRRYFNISLEDYDNMLEKQKGVCAICKNPETQMGRWGSQLLAVDHDHQTGKVRGLLCMKCNQGLGSFKDNVEFLKSAIEYLLVNQ